MDITIPRSAADELPDENDDSFVPLGSDAYIPNFYKDKEFLTVLEALDQITKLSGMVLADQFRRKK